MKRMTLLVCVATMALGARLPAQGAAVPSPAPVDLAPHAVAVSGAAGSRDRDSAGAGPLKGVQARQVRPGEARLVLAGGEKTVHPGDLIGTDLVKAIEPGRMLLTRPL